MKPRVLFISGREPGYIRNRILLAALRQDYDVRVLTPAVRSTPARIVAGLARFLATRPQYDVCLAGFYGQPIAIALSALQRKPIVLDAFVSTYDTLCDDRRTFGPRSPAGRLAYWLDVCSCQVANRVITDTAATARYFVDVLGLPAGRFAPIYVGCDESLFYPRPAPGPNDARREVFYYGAFLPLHGAEIVIQAAALLRNRTDIHFVIGGDGPRLPAARRMVAELGLTNIDLLGWIAMERLPDYIARSSVCLGGHFSTIPKAARVVSTKTYQFIAMRRPTITGDNAAVHEIFVPDEHVLAVPMGEARALADAICHLVDDAGLAEKIAGGGYELFRREFTIPAIARQLAPVMARAIAGAGTG